MQRRHLLLGSAPALLLGRSAHANGWNAWGSARGARRLSLRLASTGARFSGIYHNGSVPDAGAIRELSLLLADSRTGASRPYDPRVFDIIWELGIRERLDEYLVLSGYRTPETNAAVCGAGNSQHLHACAIDVMVPPSKLPSFGQAAIQLGRGGVGLYGNRGFVHVDTGPVRQWGEVGDGTGTGMVAVRSVRPDPIARMAEAWRAVSGR